MAEYLRDPLLAQLEVTAWNQLLEYFVKKMFLINEPIW
jgi:hypothetical protein